MADPLSEYADRTVPAPTNYFDPAAAQTIISRYANTRAERGVLDAVADTTARRQQITMNDQRIARDAALMTQEDDDYRAKNEALKGRGDFLRTMAKDLDPRDPGYNKKVTELMATIPPELAADESVRGVLHSMNAEADDYRSQENARVSGERMLDRQQQMFREKSQFGLKNIKPEDLANAPRLADGSPDLQYLGAVNNERERAYREGEFTRKQGLSLQGKLQVIDAKELSKKGQARRANVQRFIVEDKAAFPPRFVNEVVQEFSKTRKAGAPKATTFDLENDPEWKGKLRAAQQRDNNPLNSELSSAFAYDDPDTYINLVPKLSDSQKERRRQVWEHAHRDEAVEESPGEPGAPVVPPAMAVPATTAPAPAPAPTQAPATKNPLTREAAAQFKDKAKGDRALAEKLAREAGYDF